jgi:DNA polymerase-1
VPTSSTPCVYVDGHNLLHRAAFGFPARITTRRGHDITLVFGFFALIRAGVRSLDHASEVVVVFDGQYGANDRRKLLPGYKPPVTGDQEAFGLLPKIHEGLDHLGVRWIEDDRWEADDVIATLVAAQPQREHVIMSTDKDFYQLLSDRVSLLNTQRRADRRRIDPTEVHVRHCVAPDQWCDYRALAGDPSDNIPGIRGVGPKTASRLLADGVHLEDLDKLDRLAGRLGDLVRHHWDELLLWRTIIHLRTDLPLPVPGGEPQPTSLPSAPEIVGELGLWDM